jgi:hypothetical protein
MNVILSLLIVTVIGVGGHRHEPLHNAAVRVEPFYHHSHPLFRRLTDRHGRVTFHFVAGRYEISASRGNRLCAVRKVTLTGGTKRVTLTCHIR